LFKSVGYTWQQIADNLGYRSRQAAQQAATRFEAKNPPESVEAARRREGEALRIIKATLFERFADAKHRGDNDAMVALSRELRNTSDAIARLNGLNTSVAQQVDVNVHHSATAIIDRMETELLALAARQPNMRPALGAVIEGKLIEG
jgi:hypothetical protein